MSQLFTAQFFIQNRETLLARSEAQLIVLSAHGLLQRSADTTFPFRQDSNFWYLTGIEQPDYVLVLSQTELFLIAPKRSEHRDVWDGTVYKKELQASSGIKEILEHHDGWLRLDLLMKKYKKVHTITPAETYFEHFGFYANPARAHLLEAINKHRKLEVVDIRKILAYQRQIKQVSEIKALKKAINITSKSLQVVHKKLNSYKSEYEITAELSKEFLKRGATGHAYQPIVASEKNAATIHYINNNAQIVGNAFLLLDVGAEVNNYSADITRTFVVGTVSKRHKEIFEAVVRVKQAATDILKPGINLKEYEQQVDLIMAKELKKLKLLDNIKDKKKLKKYYPHLTSHFLGLDTHDAADYFRPLEPRMVLTIEPGIYIPEENIGVRIEDDVMITQNGIENLCASLPVGLG
jgi:Xaa-Pro aminopeptidase